MAHEYGKEWPDYIPRGQVSWLMGQIHVYAPESEVRAEFAKRRPKAATDEQFEVIIQYALACQQEHRDLCREFRL